MSYEFLIAKNVNQIQQKIDMTETFFVLNAQYFAKRFTCMTMNLSS